MDLGDRIWDLAVSFCMFGFHYIYSLAPQSLDPSPAVSTRRPYLVAGTQAA